MGSDARRGDKAVRLSTLLMGLGKVVGKKRMRTIEDAAGGQRVGGACDGTGPAKR